VQLEEILETLKKVSVPNVLLEKVQDVVQPIIEISSLRR
jgi:hypothetical protein